MSDLGTPSNGELPTKEQFLAIKTYGDFIKGEEINFLDDEAYSPENIMFGLLAETGPGEIINPSMFYRMLEGERLLDDESLSFVTFLEHPKVKQNAQIFLNQICAMHEIQDGTKVAVKALFSGLFEIEMLDEGEQSVTKTSDGYSAVTQEVLEAQEKQFIAIANAGNKLNKANRTSAVKVDDMIEGFIGNASGYDIDKIKSIFSSILQDPSSVDQTEKGQFVVFLADTTIVQNASKLRTNLLHNVELGDLIREHVFAFIDAVFPNLYYDIVGSRLKSIAQDNPENSIEEIFRTEIFQSFFPNTGNSQANEKYNFNDRINISLIINALFQQAKIDKDKNAVFYKFIQDSGVQSLIEEKISQLKNEDENDDDEIAIKIAQAFLL